MVCYFLESIINFVYVNSSLKNCLPYKTILDNSEWKINLLDLYDVVLQKKVSQ